jgi:transcription antitermination factor NusA-like protein
MIVFVIPGFAVEQAIGRDNANLKNLSGILAKRIRVLAEPQSEQDIAKFVSVLVSPAKFDRIDVINGESGKEVAITTNDRESKAMLIGRDRIREKELKEILEQYFKVKTVRIL